MKDLIVIFAHCPTIDKKKILEDFLFSLQEKRKKFDLLLVSHSEVSDLTTHLVDYFYLELDNKLLRDFNLTNKFWFKSGSMSVYSSLVFPFTTHLAIYQLLYFSLNFAKFKGYKKIHCIEYDINFNDLSLIDGVNSLLDQEDAVMFQDLNSKWVYGIYFAANINRFDFEDFIYNEEEIINQLKNSDSRMTETITPKIIIKDNSTIKYLDISEINLHSKTQKIDSHETNGIKWIVPVWQENTDNLLFFIYNESGVQKKIGVLVDDNYFKFNIKDKGIWSVHKIGNFDTAKEIRVYVDNVEVNSIHLDETNRDSFKRDNFCRFS